MRAFTWCLALTLAFSAGCLTTPEDDNNDPPAFSTTGFVQGFAFLSSGNVVIVDAAANAPEGATPLNGGETRILSPGGELVVSGQTGSDGFFSSEVPAGLHTLEVRQSAAAASPDASLPFTAVASATVTLGKSYAVDRDAAVNGAIQGAGSGITRLAASEDWLVLASVQPIPSGTILEPHSLAPGSSTTLNADSWLVFIDPQFNAAYAHDVEYVLVDAATNAVTRVAAAAPPTLNGQNLWKNSYDYLIFHNWALGEELEPFPEDLEVSPTAELYQIPSVLAEGFRTGFRSTREFPQSVSGDPEDLFAMIVLTAKDPWFIGAAVDFLEWARAQGIPEKNIGFYGFLYNPSGDAGFKAWNAARDAFYAKIQEREQAGGEPSLFYYICGHHVIDEGEPQVRMETEPASGETGSFFPSSVNATSIRACKVWLIWDTCFSELMAEAIERELSNRTVRQRAQFTIVHACREDERTYSNVSLPPIYSLFGRALVNQVSIADDEMAGLIQDGAIHPSLAKIDPWGPGEMHPNYIFVDGNPEWCDPPPLLTTDDTQHTYIHTNQSPCPSLIGTVTLTNPTGETVSWATNEMDVVNTNPVSATIEPGESMEVELLFNCDRFTSRDVTVTFRALSGEQQTDLTVTVTLDLRVTPGSNADDFVVRHPLLNFSTSLYLSHPAGSVIDSTSLVDAATQEPVAPFPWLPDSGIGWSSVEGPHPEFSNFHGITVSITNPLSVWTCVCPPLTWTYRIYYSFPQ